MTAVQDWGIVGPGSSDAELALAAAAGDRRAFAGIYDRYANRLHDFCAGMLADRDAAADCVQDAFCDAATSLRDLREPDKLRAWLYGIARHQCLRRLRDRRRVHPSDALPDMASADAGPDALARRTELADLIAEAAGGLSDRDRAVLELSYRHDLNPLELAQALGVSQSNANTMVHRLRQTMERSLGALLVCRRARANPDRCPELAAILHGWDGHFTILIRKRVARHIEGCTLCERERRGLLNPVALLGTAPVFLPAPDWLRDKTLNQIQLTSAGIDMMTDAGVATPVDIDAPTERSTPVDIDRPTERSTPVDIDGPTERFAPDSGEPEVGEKRDRSRLMLLIALLVGLPLVAFGLTIAVLRLPDSAVAPSGDTQKVPSVTNGNPAGPTPTAGTPQRAAPTSAPRNITPALTPQPAQANSPAPPAVAPSQPDPTTAKSQEAQRPTTRQARTFTPAPPQQRAPVPAEAEPADPGPAALPPPEPAPAQQAPAPEPAQPPVPIQDQVGIQERHSPPAGDATTTVPYPR